MTRENDTEERPILRGVTWLQIVSLTITLMSMFGGLLWGGYTSFERIASATNANTVATAELAGAVRTLSAQMSTSREADARHDAEIVSMAKIISDHSERIRALERAR